MEDYTPTTEEVRGHFIYGVDDLSATNTEARTAEFDRWLAAHDAYVREHQALISREAERARSGQRVMDYIFMCLSNGTPIVPSAVVAAARGEDTR